MMEPTKTSTIHVCSIIPGISQALRDNVPAGVEVRDVPMDDESDKPMAEKLKWRVGQRQIEALKEAEILVAEGRTLAQLASHLPKTKWVQLTVTGVDRIFQQMPLTTKPEFVVTRNIGTRISQLMAEYVVGQIISHERSWPRTHQNQINKTYDRSDEFSLTRSLAQVTVGILGLGSMSIEVARVLKSFRCRVVGFGRNPRSETEISSYLDECWYTGQLQLFFENCDYLVNMLPSTPETKGMLGKDDVLKEAKKKPVFINIGRGDVIKEVDLVKALQESWISAAILDVHEQEPIPQESLLWLHPKVTITPHVSGFGSFADRIHSVTESFLENYRRFTDGQPLEGVINWDAGY